MCLVAWGRAIVEAQHLRDLARLRRVRDRIDREFTQPLDVEELARGVQMSAEDLSREFSLAYRESPYHYLTRRRAGMPPYAEEPVKQAVS
jgi:transcriptional regulator GlxA family with amidase domain